MNTNDHAAAEGHLELAVRHLETARSLLVSADGSPNLGGERRELLHASATDAEVELDHLARLIAGETLESELARLIGEMGEHADYDDRDGPDQR